MKIIRDEQLCGIGMIPIFVEWGIKRCNVAGCKNKPNTIIANLQADLPPFGLCEQHYQQGNVHGGTHFDLEFDDFDAFAEIVPFDDEPVAE